MAAPPQKSTRPSRRRRLPAVRRTSTKAACGCTSTCMRTATAAVPSSWPTAALRRAPTAAASAVAPAAPRGFSATHWPGAVAPWSSRRVTSRKRCRAPGNRSSPRSQAVRCASRSRAATPEATTAWSPSTPQLGSASDAPAWRRSWIWIAWSVRCRASVWTAGTSTLRLWITLPVTSPTAVGARMPTTPAAATARSVGDAHSLAASVGHLKARHFPTSC
mmetsp:Transcript_96480/g.277103  ORF Transcript_96480/g.277103 Transcript_96480/m.277103 type:complete len:219 (-) Transcript_96480:560-1216(-)